MKASERNEQRLYLFLEEKALLEEAHQTCENRKEGDRIKAILLRSESWTVPQISQALRLHQSTIIKHIEAYKKAGILKNQSEGLLAFIPQLACHDDYGTMLENVEFRKAYGVAYSYEEALLRLKSDMDYWNQYAFAPFMWYEKKTHNYVGRGGLKLFRRNSMDDFEVELTYQIKREHWNEGYAQEMGRRSINYGFNVLNLSNIICFTAYDNYSSLHVMQKLGFVFEEDFTHVGVTHKLYRLLKASL